MNASQKQQLHQEAQAHTDAVCAQLGAAETALAASLAATMAKLRGPQTPELELERKLYAHKALQHGNIASLARAPYFFRCDVRLQNEVAPKPLYFGKHSFSEASIFSWVSPAAALRFEPMGAASYRTNDGSTRSVDVFRKDEYMIVDGKVVFMATENRELPRTLVHQEHFTSRKHGFVLPDIVAQMEKAQDTVIRAAYKGSFLIAGPAGSGKTTLALHRVAYLAQSPDTAKLFPPEQMIVFVQDESAKGYFGGLLPELGINGVTVCTFAEWALRVLGLVGHTPVSLWSEDESVNDEYLFAKRRALDGFAAGDAIAHKDIYAYLHDAYEPTFSALQRKMLTAQADARRLDRFDLAILLRRALHEDGQLRETVEYDDVVRGKRVKRTSRTTMSYSLIIVDEAENWLAEELQILRGCVSTETEAIVYVGDLHQRTQLGTVQSWEQVGEAFGADRKVQLRKVYRNTKQILRYAESLGYEVDIPEMLQEDSDVAFGLEADASAYCDRVVAGASDTVGIIAKHERDLVSLRARFAANPNVRVMTVSAAQGMEFGAVVIVGMGEFDAGSPDGTDTALATERAAINRDLRYVAITRAMRELHVLR